MRPKDLYKIDMELVRVIEEEGSLLWMEEYTGESGRHIRLALYMMDSKDIYTIRYVDNECVLFIKSN